MVCFHDTLSPPGRSANVLVIYMELLLLKTKAAVSILQSSMIFWRNIFDLNFDLKFSKCKTFLSLNRNKIENSPPNFSNLNSDFAWDIRDTHVILNQLDYCVPSKLLNFHSNFTLKFRLKWPLFNLYYTFWPHFSERCFLPFR